MKKKYLLLFLLILTGCNKQENGCNEAGISIEEFNNINLNMTQFEVNDIIDNAGILNNDEIYTKCIQEISKSSNNGIYEYTYKYLGENKGYALITFTVDYSDSTFFNLPTVSKKEQFNLQ